MRKTASALFCGCSLLVCAPAMAQDRPTTLNYFGMPGLVDMPTANVLPDAELAFTLAAFASTGRGTLSFQALPSVTASFRYAGLDGFRPGGNVTGQDPTYYDRSFDVHWQVIREGGWWPALAIGARDIAGTGIYSGEYIVATRHFGADDQLSVTAGVGFGRLGERGAFSNPFGLDDRPRRDVGQGGTTDLDQFFRGDAAFFGGIEWSASDRLRLQLEYSSDLYREEVADGLLTVDSPINAGFTYRVNDFATIGGHYLYGNTFGLSVSILTNPRRPGVTGTYDSPPEPISPRPARPPSGYSTAWIAEPTAPGILRDNLERLMQEDGGLSFEGLRVDANRATIRVRNLSYSQEAQAVGRVMRILSVTMPSSVSVFEVIFLENGLETSRIRLDRGDLEVLENELYGASLAVSLAEVEDPTEVADANGIVVAAGSRERLTWGVGPYIDATIFDPENPFRANLGIEGQARYEITPSLIAQGAVRIPVVGNLDDSRVVDVPPTGAPFPVRSERALYNQQSDAYVDNLTLSYYHNVGNDVYARASVGYFERMFAGVSGELLWQPANSTIGVGFELNHVWRRDFDGGFGLQDYNVTTGHVSAYFDLGREFEGQIDVGRYLAGDLGATFRVNRVFDNGWSIGAFATFTDVSFDEFGEGSFDKGVELTIPLQWLTGNASRNVAGGTIRPTQRDGGARLEMDGRLHDLVTGYQRPSLEDTEGMFWR